MAPRLGLRRFTSLITEMVGRVAASPRKGGGAGISAALRAISATRLSRAGIVARTESRIWSRIAILRFGIPSGNVNGDFGFSSRSGGIVSLTRKQRNILDYLTRA